MIEYLLNIFANFGYTGIAILMAIESSIIPFPSEVVMPPAGYLVSQGKFNLYLVIGSGILGSILGALLNYYLAKHLGSRIVHRLARTKWAKWLLISPESLTKAEEYFRRYGSVSTFIGRLLPAIRQLISIPAGLAKMPLAPFLFFTALGSGIWCSILTLLGYYFGANQEKLHQYYQEISLTMVILALLASIIWLLLKLRRNNNVKNNKTL